ncbi:MAG: GxxExxY protein, partial [Candidatus Shapirobacteria bacterium]|nr:GxxExxY protein [Candidatus Shapirobacteria bacterium]
MTQGEEKIVYKELSYKINGILFKARNDVGLYGNEKQYCDAIEKRLIEQKISFEREKVLEISFDGEHKGRNRVDFLIDSNIIPVSYTHLKL